MGSSLLECGTDILEPVQRPSLLDGGPGFYRHQENSPGYYLDYFLY